MLTQPFAATTGTQRATRVAHSSVTSNYLLTTSTEPAVNDPALVHGTYGQFIVLQRRRIDFAARLIAWSTRKGDPNSHRF